MPSRVYQLRRAAKVPVFRTFAVYGSILSGLNEPNRKDVKDLNPRCSVSQHMYDYMYTYSAYVISVTVTNAFLVINYI